MCGNLVSIRNQLVDMDASKWEQQFVALCEAKKHELEPKWREDWKSLANGKLILNQVFRDLKAKLSYADAPDLRRPCPSDAILVAPGGHK